MRASSRWGNRMGKSTLGTLTTHVNEFLHTGKVWLKGHQPVMHQILPQEVLFLHYIHCAKTEKKIREGIR